jgi:hypothetical protein
LTSATPNTSILEAFSQLSSVVIESTPAGWTYVGSTFAGDRPTIAVANSAVNQANSTFPNLAFSAPCLNGTTKFCVLTTTHAVASVELNNNFTTLTGAQSVNANGICTNEGGRWFNSTSDSQSELTATSLKVGIAGTTIHLIANERHVTIIEEGRGLQAVLEMSATDLNTFYDTAPFVQYSHADTSLAGRADSGIIVPTLATTSRGSSMLHTGFNITDPNTATTYGTYDPTQNVTTNVGFFVRNTGTGSLKSGINTAGLPRYNILPVILSNDEYGHPTQYITGIVPVYFTGPSIGTSGDTVDVDGDTYYFFNSGTGFGLLMKLS